MMLDDPASQNNNTSLLSAHGKVIYLAHILNDINADLLRRSLESMEVQHITQTTIRERGTENGDIILPRPVVNRFLVVDLFT